MWACVKLFATWQKSRVLRVIKNDKIATIRDLPWDDTDTHRTCFVELCFSTLDPCTFQMAISLALRRIGMVLYTQWWHSTKAEQEIQPNRQKCRWPVRHRPKSSSRWKCSRNYFCGRLSLIIYKRWSQISIHPQRCAECLYSKVCSISGNRMADHISSMIVRQRVMN